MVFWFMSAEKYPALGAGFPVYGWGGLSFPFSSLSTKNLNIQRVIIKIDNPESEYLLSALRIQQGIVRVPLLWRSKTGPDLIIESPQTVLGRP